MVMYGGQKMKKLLFETDWLASQPVFYNENTGLASHNINDVIDYSNLEFHPEGFNNYLDFGYSILEQTPIKHIKFLRHSSKLWIDDEGKLSIEYLDDPVEQWLDYKLTEEEIINLIRERVRSWEHSVDGDIIIPTSGGYDSRLLNWCIEDKSRVRSFTYGISEKQNESFEVVYARKLSELLGTRWEQIPLGDFHKYFEDWDKLFSISTHAHGMYHFEFYKRILPKVEKSSPFLSGIIGDAWAGSVNIPTLKSKKDIKKLGYTHGMHSDSTKSVFTSDNKLLSNYWDIQKDRLKDSRIRTIESMRLKMILLCYLRSVPEYFGFNWWSPFLDIDISMAMLNLSSERKQGRLWQKEFFKKKGLELESMNLESSRNNTLDLQGLDRIPVNPINTKLLKEVIKPYYSKWINRKLLNTPLNWRENLIIKLLHIKNIGGIMRRLGFNDKSKLQLKAYNNYVVLLPIEKLLQKRYQNNLINK